VLCVIDVVCFMCMYDVCSLNVLDLKVRSHLAEPKPGKRNVCELDIVGPAH